MSAFEPGEGWREVDPSPSRDERLCLVAAGVISRQWVRESTVPPLPTEPYTVIRPTWPYGKLDTEYFLLPDGEWLDVVLGRRYRSEQFARITGFEVLAEPRARADGKYAEKVRRETATEFYDEMRRLLNSSFVARQMHDSLDAIARKFGVDA